MDRQGIFFVCFIGFLSLINASAIPEPSNMTAIRIEETRERLKNLANHYSYPNSELEHNPQLILNNPWLTAICKHNVDGNYQNPFNCNQFIMCAGGSVYLWSCPADGAYDPIPDECVYRGAEQCPWRSIWIYPSDVKCSTLGQRPFWSPLTFPAHPRDRCCQDIFYCFNYKTIGTSRCPDGYGYSKAYLACLPLDQCYAIDRYFKV